MRCSSVISMDTDSQSDQELIAAYVANRQSDMLAIVVRRYIKLLYHFAYAMVGNAHDAEDVVQETYVKAWKHITSYDAEKSFKAWLLRIAKNTAIDHLRAVHVQTFSLDEADGALAYEHVQESFMHAWRKREVEHAMHQLPSLYRPLMDMRYREDLTLEEIADIFGEPLNTVKSRYTRALALLRRAVR